MKQILLVFILLTLTAKTFALSPMEDPYRVNDEVLTKIKDYVETSDVLKLSLKLGEVQKIVKGRGIVVKSPSYYQNLERESAEQELVEIIVKLRQEVKKRK